MISLLCKLLYHFSTIPWCNFLRDYSKFQKTLKNFIRNFNTVKFYFVDFTLSIKKKLNNIYSRKIMQKVFNKILKKLRFDKSFQYWDQIDHGEFWGEKIEERRRMNYFTTITDFLFYPQLNFFTALMFLI